MLRIAALAICALVSAWCRHCSREMRSTTKKPTPAPTA
jgi:hypothetical protein